MPAFKETFMRINHIAIWIDDIELLKNFYVRYFGAVEGARYHNPAKNFTSCFLSFPDGDATLELMNAPGIISTDICERTRGLCHVAISVGSKSEVDRITETMRLAGVPVLGNPRLTGDGYYESVIADPEGNMVEITI